MSRPSAIWVFFWLVMVSLVIVVWRVSKRNDTQEPASSGDAGLVNRHESDAPVLTGLKPDGLLKSLPAPQSPPLKLSVEAKKQWQDELVGLIDDAAYLEDEASLRMLIVELANPDAGVAKAAFTSLQARRDEKALPYLQEMRELNLKPEKTKQLDALIEFLNQKSVFEHLRSEE